MAILNLIDDGVNDFAIYQGRDYQLSLFQVGNITGDFVGIIRDNYDQSLSLNDQSLCSEFRFKCSEFRKKNKKRVYSAL